MTEINGFDVVRGGTGGGVFLYATRHDEPVDGERRAGEKVRPPTLLSPFKSEALPDLALALPQPLPQQGFLEQENEGRT